MEWAPLRASRSASRVVSVTLLGREGGGDNGNHKLWGGNPGQTLAQGFLEPAPGTSLRWSGKAELAASPMGGGQKWDDRGWGGLEEGRGSENQGSRATCGEREREREERSLNTHYCPTSTGGNGKLKPDSGGSRARGSFRVFRDSFSSYSLLRLAVRSPTPWKMPPTE